jgi:predicted S18 family serine protease
VGRTNPTFRDLLASLEDSWQNYRRALRRTDQDRFDRLWEDSRQYADAAGYLNHQNPMVVVLFSMVLAQEKRIEDLETELEGERATDRRDDTDNLAA